MSTPVPAAPRPLEPAVAATPGAWSSAADGPAVSRLWWVTGPLLGLLVISFLWVGLTKVPYITFAPGGARSVEPLVTLTQVAGGPRVHQERADDDLLYVTVSTRAPVAFEALAGVLQADVQVEPSKPYYGTQTEDENRTFNQELMTDSQDKARKVALDRLGYRVGTEARGTFLEDVDPSFPAGKVLRPGTTILRADGAVVSDAEALVAAIAAHRPGDTMRLTIRPLGAPAPTEVSVRLSSRPDDPTKAVLGVNPADAVSYTFPVGIRIDTGKVGGPSAGLAFTLAILDRLTPGALLGRERVAVTGTIELDGTVGPVGGVDLKAKAAIREGADLFIVPPDEYDVARRTAHGRLQVERASTLDQVLSILERHGGDPLPSSKGR